MPSTNETLCEVCGSRCRIVGTVTKHYEPIAQELLDAKDAEIAKRDERIKELEETLNMAYRKYCHDDWEVGWVELGDKLHDVIENGRALKAEAREVKMPEQTERERLIDRINSSMFREEDKGCVKAIEIADFILTDRRVLLEEIEDAIKNGRYDIKAKVEIDFSEAMSIIKNRMG